MYMTAAKGNVAAYFSSPPLHADRVEKNPKVRGRCQIRRHHGRQDIVSGDGHFSPVASVAATFEARRHPVQGDRRKPPRSSATIRDAQHVSLAELRAVQHAGRRAPLKPSCAISRMISAAASCGVEATAAVMSQDGRLKNAPASWKDVVAPVLASGSRS